MKLVNCPDVYNPEDKNLRVFLGGGISNCPNWQQYAIKRLDTCTNLTLFNPRRAAFDVTDPTLSTDQIQWEFEHLKACDVFFFWFPKETVCPITLFELGMAVMTNKPVIVGVHPEYVRKIDIVTQTSLYRPDIQVLFNLTECLRHVENLSQQM